MPPRAGSICRAEAGTISGPESESREESRSRRPVDLATIPLYVRAGAIIPFDPVRQYTGENANGPLSLSIYPGADGRFQLYEDDGVSFNYPQGRLDGHRDELG